MEERDFTLGGMHGYDPQLSDMHGIFYAFGPEIKENLQISAFENIHIYPIICKILDILPYAGETDTPEGDIRILNKILLEKTEVLHQMYMLLLKKNPIK